MRPLPGFVFGSVVSQLAQAQITSPYKRGPQNDILKLDHPLLAPKQAGAGVVEQRKLTFVDQGVMRLSWVSPAGSSTDSTVFFGSSPDNLSNIVVSKVETTSYTCEDSKCGGPHYWSGLLHMATLSPLPPGTTAFYRIGEDATGEVVSFPVPHSPVLVEGYPFAIIGDLGQTNNSDATMKHVIQSGSPFLVHVGDLSYADCDQPRWDSYGRLVDPYAKSLPWMTVTGNHEVEKPAGYCGLSMNQSFAAYDARYGAALPYLESGSTDMHYYSFETAGAHWVMLGSYTDFDVGSAQLTWLAQDLASVDRGLTPWLFVALHSPWYNSNAGHQNEPEEVNFRAVAESMLRAANVNAVFAGHVHAYERSFPVFENEVSDPCAPVYVTIGDGGNREGLYDEWLTPQPAWSAFREASYGHGVLTLVNATTATWTWHRNQDGEPAVADNFTINRCV